MPTENKALEISKEWTARAKAAKKAKLTNHVVQWTLAIAEYEETIEILRLKRVIFKNELFRRERL